MRVEPTDLSEPITRPRYDYDPPTRRDYALAQLRTAFLRAQAVQAEISSIGIALRANEISPEVALAWLQDAALVYDPTFEAPEITISDAPKMMEASS